MADGDFKARLQAMAADPDPKVSDYAKAKLADKKRFPDEPAVAAAPTRAGGDPSDAAREAGKGKGTPSILERAYDYVTKPDAETKPSGIPNPETGKVPDGPPGAMETVARGYANGAIPEGNSMLGGLWQAFKTAPNEAYMDTGPDGKPLGRLDQAPDPMSEMWKGGQEAENRLEEGNYANNDVGKLAEILGMATGPMGKASGKVGKAVHEAIGPTTALGRIGTSVASGSAAGAFDEGTRRLAAGDDLPEVVRRTLDAGLLGAASSVPGALMREGTIAAAPKVMNKIAPRTEDGRLQTQTGQIAVRNDEAIEDGSKARFDKEVQGKAGIGEKGFQQSLKHIDISNDITKDARASYGAGLGAIGKPDELFDSRSVIDALDGSVKHASNGKVAVEDLQKAVDDVKGYLQRETDNPKLFGPSGDVVSGGQKIERKATLGDLRIAKEHIVDKAEFGQPSTSENRPYRLLYGELAGATHTLPNGVGDKMKALDGTFKAQMDKVERANDIAFGQDTPEVSERASTEKRGGNWYARALQDTTAGGVQNPQMIELAALDPRYKALVDEMEKKVAVEGSKFGMSNLSRPVERVGVAALEQSAQALASKAYRGARKLRDAAAKSTTGRVTPAQNEALRQWMLSSDPTEASMQARKDRQEELQRQRQAK